MQHGARNFILAAIFAAIAAGLAAVWLKQRERAIILQYAPKKVARTNVIVPKRFIAAGEYLSAENLAGRPIPAEFVPDNVVLAKDFRTVTGRLATMDLAAGKVVPWAAVLGERQREFSDTIALGRRAKTIRVGAIESFDGMLRPSDRIDLYGTFATAATPYFEGQDENRPPQVLVPVLQNVHVMATGKRSADLDARAVAQDPFNRESAYSTITVSVTPKEAAKLTLAERTGELTAVLRNSEDAGATSFEYATTFDVFRDSEADSTELVYDPAGNLVGRLVGDKVVNAQGQVVASMAGDRLVSTDGKDLGAALVVKDEGDPVSVVLDRNGEVIGVRRGNVVYGNDGEVKARIVDGRVLALNGTELNDHVETAVLKHEQTAVLDASGKVIGHRVGDKVVNEDGKIVGTLARRNVSDQPVTVTGANGETIGKVVTDPVTGEARIVDDQGRTVGIVETDPETGEQRILDLNGQVIEGSQLQAPVGDIVLVDPETGQVLAEGLAAERRPVGDLTAPTQVVLDEQGNPLGTRVGNNVIDSSGRVIAEIRNGKVIGKNGNVITDSVTTRSEAGGTSFTRKFMEYIAGGSSNGGIAEVRKIPLNAAGDQK